MQTPVVPNTCPRTGGSGNGDTQLFVPLSVELHGDDDLVIADAGNNRVQVCSLSSPGSPCTTLGGDLVTPQGATVDGDGNHVIADSGNMRVQLCSSSNLTSCTTVFDKNTVIANEISRDALYFYYYDVGGTRVYSVAVDALGDFVLAAGVSVVKCSGADCVEMVSDLSFTHHVAILPSGEYLIADTRNHKVLRCPSSPGTSASECTTVAGGSQGSGSTQLDYPIAAVMDENGDYVIADSINERVQLCSATSPKLHHRGWHGCERLQC